MMNRGWTILAAAVLLGLNAGAYAAEGDQPVPGRQMAPSRSEVPSLVVAMGQDGIQRVFATGVRIDYPHANWFGRDQVSEILSLLAQLNLAPGFTLTDDQKIKIAGVREEYQKAMLTWTQDHAEEMDQLDAEARDLRRGRPNLMLTPEERQELAQNRLKLLESAPKSTEFAQQILTLLTDEQRKVVKTQQDNFEAILAEQQKIMIRQRAAGSPRITREPGGPEGTVHSPNTGEAIPATQPASRPTDTPQ